MNFEILIPITLFICIVYAIKVVVDARLRKQMVDSNGAQDLVRSMLESEELQRRHASLRWGIILGGTGRGVRPDPGFGLE